MSGDECSPFWAQYLSDEAEISMGRMAAIVMGSDSG